MLLQDAVRAGREMTTVKVLVLACSHIGNGDMVSSAKLCLQDAILLLDEGDLAHARKRALRSLAYSVGILHQDYARASEQSP
jgi:hypothetical protein